MLWNLKIKKSSVNKRALNTVSPQEEKLTTPPEYLTELREKFIEPVTESSRPVFTTKEHKRPSIRTTTVTPSTTQVTTTKKRRVTRRPHRPAIRTTTDISVTSLTKEIESFFDPPVPPPRKPQHETSIDELIKALQAEARKAETAKIVASLSEDLSDVDLMRPRPTLQKDPQLRVNVVQKELQRQKNLRTNIQHGMRGGK